MDNFKNLYELTKTLRFEAVPRNNEAKNKNELDSASQASISDFTEQCKNIQKKIIDIFIYEINKEKNVLKFKEGRKIKYGWLRNYIKIDFYDWKKENNRNDKEYFLTEIDYLSKEVLKWAKEWNELIEQLTELTQTEEHEKERKSEIALVLRRFLKRQNFEFIQEFVKSVMDLQDEKGVKLDKKLQELKNLISETYINLKACEREYLPTQSAGVCLYKASLNYYTINKTPKEYGDLKEDKEKELERQISNFLFERTQYDKKTKRRSVCFNCSDDWLIEIGLGTDIKRKSLDEAYQKLKEWKANQKSKFNEAVAGDKLSVTNFRKKFPLFDTSNENFEEFYKLTKKLDDEEGENAKKIAQKRGKFFNAPNQTIQIKNYYELCELYKRIAMKRGKIIAEIKGLKNEEVQSQMLSHWALIAQKGEKRYAIFIPREKSENNKNHKDAYDRLEKDKEGLQQRLEDSVILYHFKSLTFRALEKLCFKEKHENTFMPEIRKEIKFIPKYKEEWYQEEDHGKLIEFYKQVLQTDYVVNNLDLVDFGELQNFLKKDFNNLQEFESELERVCYVKVPLYFPESEFYEFLEKFNAKEFEMTTRSISGNKKENAHASYWKDFWSDKNEKDSYITRLNPEMSVFYRESLDEKEGNRNRFSKEQFTVATTVTLNATSEKSNLAFKTIDDLKANIDRFNKRFNENFKGEWTFGIDRGLKELATLNIVKFAKDKNEFGVSKPEEFAKIEVWKLLDEQGVLKKEDGSDWLNAKGEKRKIIDNISEVLEESANLFKKEKVSSIDLTQAKLIKGHIVLNGDQKTCLKLKELSAKRRIFELFSTGKIDKKSEIKGKKVWSIDEHEIYWLFEWQRQNKWKTEKEKLKSILEKYLQELDEKNKFFDEETILKINHLRDAITANMVGIIFHIQERLGYKGYIGLENLDIVRKDLLKNQEKEDKKMIEVHFEQSNTHISRRLEWALYRKFANVGAVPPQIKESILLRDDFSTYQIGILNFVKVGGTSSNCPNCGERSGKTKGHFICKFKTNCDFSSQENKNLLEENLNNSDEVAAYNVAKNAFDKKC